MLQRDTSPDSRSSWKPPVNSTSELAGGTPRAPMCAAARFARRSSACPDTETIISAACPPGECVTISLGSATTWVVFSSRRTTGTLAFDSCYRDSQTLPSRKQSADLFAKLELPIEVNERVCANRFARESFCSSFNSRYSAGTDPSLEAGRSLP